MYRFTMSIAGYNIEVETEIEYLSTLCASYLVQNQPEFHVVINSSEIENEKKKNEVNGKLNYVSDEKCAFLVLLRKIAEELVEQNVLLIHGAAITLDERSYLFTAKSGTGKTTHICKWIQNRPDLIVINGDKPFIKIGETPLIYGSPWAGKECLSTNIMKPLNAIIILERSESNKISSISFTEAFPILLNSIYLSDNVNKRNKAVKALLSLNKKLSFYKYQVNNLKNDCFSVIYDEIHSQGMI